MAEMTREAITINGQVDAILHITAQLAVHRVIRDLFPVCIQTRERQAEAHLEAVDTHMAEVEEDLTFVEDRLTFLEIELLHTQAGRCEQEGTQEHAALPSPDSRPRGRSSTLSPGIQNTALTASTRATSPPPHLAVKIHLERDIILPCGRKLYHEQLMINDVFSTCMAAFEASGPATYFATLEARSHSMNAAVADGIAALDQLEAQQEACHRKLAKIHWLAAHPSAQSQRRKMQIQEAKIKKHLYLCLETLAGMMVANAVHMKCRRSAKGIIRAGSIGGVVGQEVNRDEGFVQQGDDVSISYQEQLSRAGLQKDRVVEGEDEEGKPEEGVRGEVEAEGIGAGQEGKNRKRQQQQQAKLSGEPRDRTDSTLTTAPLDLVPDLF